MKGGEKKGREEMKVNVYDRLTPANLSYSVLLNYLFHLS